MNGLQESCPPTRDTFSNPNRLNYSPLKIDDIRWNWEKFLITKEGKPHMRYDPSVKPVEIERDIKFLLQKNE